MNSRIFSARSGLAMAVTMMLVLPSMAVPAEARQLAMAQVQSAAPAQAAAPVQRPISASKIILVGDSTTAVVGGWGPSFCAHHVTSFLACLNLARGGRSSGSYRAEGSWAIALSEMQAPQYAEVYVLIQFGHNDQPGKPGRSTDLATEFPANLRRYVEETRAQGAIPILVTPLARRQFVEGQHQNDLSAWADAIRQVAAETGAPVVDLNAQSAKSIQALGPMLSAQFAQGAPSREVAAALLNGTSVPASTGIVPAPAMSPATVSNPAEASTSFPPAGGRTGTVETSSVIQARADAEPLGQARIAFDYTHLGTTGADFFARMVTQELAIAVPDLRRHLIP